MHALMPKISLSDLGNILYTQLVNNDLDFIRLMNQDPDQTAFFPRLITVFNWCIFGNHFIVFPCSGSIKVSLRNPLRPTVTLLLMTK